MDQTSIVTGKLENEGDLKDVSAPLEGKSSSTDLDEQESGLGELIALSLSMSKQNIEGVQVKPLTQLCVGQASQDSLGNKHKCSSCPKSFSTSNGLRFHQRLHKINESAGLNQRENSFTQTRHIEAPIRETFTEMDTNAPISASIIEIKDTNLISRDLLHIHDSEDSLTTRKLLFDKRQSQIHELTHSGLKSYKCMTCGKSFSWLSYLYVHERTHSGVKPYKCGECGKSFSVLGNLNTHERIHSGVKPYKCGECGKSFSQLGHLNVHERIHSEVKPYKCGECGKSFTQIVNLNVHERIHSGVKPYKCGECGTSFRHKCALRKHERIHTGVQVQEKS